MSKQPNAPSEAERPEGRFRSVSQGSMANVVRLPQRRKKWTLPAKQRPRVLLLQGPVGPFFQRLQAGLEQNGYDAWRICFSAGDRFFSGKKKVISYNGGAEGWGDWLSAFLESSEIDHVILFGSERAIHKTAQDCAARLGIDVIALEEGYLRPGYVTVEKNANNWLSPLAGRLPDTDFEGEGSTSGNPAQHGNFRAMCAYGAIYYVLRTLFTAPASRGLFHRPIHPFADTFYWLRNGVRYYANRHKNLSTIQLLLEHASKSYFVVPLQVAVDTQLKQAGLGWTNSKLIMDVLGAFARSGPSTHRLVFKIHPLERGHSSDRQLIDQVAQMLGIADRVDVIDSGSLGLLTRYSAGMITINSTAGLSALFHGVPLLVIGEALYANDKLATCAHGHPDFDAFWEGGFIAKPHLRTRYLAWIRAKSLKPGDFYSKSGTELAVQGIMEAIDEPSRRGAGRNDVAC